MESWVRTPRTFRQDVKFYAAGALALLVWSVTPVSWAILTHWLYRWGQTKDPYVSGFSRIAWYYSVIEAPFSVFLWRISRAAQPLLNPPDIDLATLESLLDKCLGSSSPRSSSLTKEQEQAVFKSRMRRWFHGAPLKEIKEENVREWLAWAFGGSELEDIRSDAKRIELIDKALAVVSERAGYRFEPGYNPASKCLRLTLDPVRFLHRPFGYYVVCNGVTAGSESGFLPKYIASSKLTHAFATASHSLAPTQRLQARSSRRMRIPRLASKERPRQRRIILFEAYPLPPRSRYRLGTVRRVRTASRPFSGRRRHPSSAAHLSGYMASSLSTCTFQASTCARYRSLSRSTRL